MPQPQMVDRGFMKMVCIKRIVTGSLSIASGVAFIIAMFVHGSAPPPIAALAVLIFFGGGAWTLRDGLRMRRELQKT